MKLFLKILGCTAIFLFSFLKSEAQGREATIILKNGTSMSGELLSVRLAAIALLMKTVDKDEEIAEHPEIVTIARINEINYVRLEKTAAQEGGGLKAALILGGALGLIGAATDLSTPKGETQFSTAGLGIICGGLIGLIAGSASDNSKEEELIYPISNKELTQISMYARFNGDEPSYVRDIIDNLLKESK